MTSLSRRSPGKTAKIPSTGLSRRQQLQRQRAGYVWRTLWHSGLSLGILTGLVMVIRQPLWYLTAPSQIQIQGQTLLTAADVQSKLTLSFPLTLWQVEPQAVKAALIPDPPGLIQAVHLQRQILPPSLTVWIEERRLLAQATVNHVWGGIDGQGQWIPLLDYPHLQHHPGIPKLQVVGWEYLSPSQWAQFLPLLAGSGIPIQTIEATPTQGVLLQTDLGRVHLGSLTSERLPEQLQALANMKNLGEYCQCQPQDIQRIDLTSPTRPTLELTPAAMARRGAAPPLPSAGLP